MRLHLGTRFYDKNSFGLNVELENAEALKISGSLGDEAIADQVRKSIMYETEIFIGYIQETVNFFIQSGELPPEFANLIMYLYLAVALKP